MVNWQVTATTVFCDSVDDEVTLIINDEGTVKCTGQQKYNNPKKDAKKLLKTKSKSSGKQMGCKSEGCETIKQYRERMMGAK